jgi:Xaa-Pro aminopeptidase
MEAAVRKYELLDMDVVARSGYTLDALVRKIYPHNIGHYLGMDVHDTMSCDGSKALANGFYITIEPGLYLPDAPFVKPEYVVVVVVVAMRRTSADSFLSMCWLTH